MHDGAESLRCIVAELAGSASKLITAWASTAAAWGRKFSVAPAVGMHEEISSALRGDVCVASLQGRTQHTLSMHEEVIGRAVKRVSRHALQQLGGFPSLSSEALECEGRELPSMLRALSIVAGVFLLLCLSRCDQRL